MEMIKKVMKVILWLAICQLPTLISLPFVDANMTWYHTLIKPPFVPPDMIFGMVWTILYVLLGISAALMFYQGVSKKLRPAVWLLGIQLVLNACWTPIFFGMHHIAGAFTIIVLMLLEGLFLHRMFAKHNKLAAMLLWPYWAWLGFATYLTAGYLILN